LKFTQAIMLAESRYGEFKLLQLQLFRLKDGCICCVRM